MSSTEILQDRIIELEKQIYGPNKSKITEPENTVIDNLVHANTLIVSALSGREKANTLIKRLPELDGYLDKNLDDYDLQTDAKIKYILTVETEIRENLRMLTEVQSLMPVLEINRFCDVPELSKKLNDLMLNYLKANEETESLSTKVNEMFSEYNNVITLISDYLVSLDAVVTQAELAAKTKKK